MIKDISNMSMYQGCDAIFISPVVDPEYVPIEDDMMRVLREIYAVDELTGVPQGDLAYYLSSDGNPQVKEWIVNNLLKPRALAQGSSVEGVTDDMLAEFAKGRDESPSEYRERLNSIYQQASSDIEKFKLEKENNHE